MPIGIDLGTTNSSITYWDESGEKAIEVGTESEPFMDVLRTAVFMPHDPDRRSIGRTAFEAQSLDQEGLLLVSFKPRLAKERLRQRVRVPNAFLTNEYDPTTEGSVVQTEWTEEDWYDEFSRDEVVKASAGILRSMLDSLEVQVPLTPGELQDQSIWIGVPVGYGPVARRRLLHALALTGIYGEGADAFRLALNRVRFVYEPLALISSSGEITSRETVLVFDYGGGTLDLALWDAEPSDTGDVRYRELALGSHPNAGDRIDQLLLDHLSVKHPEYGSAAKADKTPFERRRTMENVATAKEKLATEESWEIQEGAARVVVTRADLEEAIAEELRLVELAIDDCLRRGVRRRHQLSRVVMSGGSSLLTPARDLLWRIFPALPNGGLTWPDPSDAESRRRALTGVSSGLAELGWQEGFAALFEPRLPGEILAWSEVEREMVVLAPQGTRLDQGPLIAGPISAAQGGNVSLALYERIAAERFIACICDVPSPVDGGLSVELEIERYHALPRIRVFANGNVVGAFDVFDLPDDDLVAFFEKDEEWAPPGSKPQSGFLTRRLRRGDHVRLPGRCEKGVVDYIRDVDANCQVDEMVVWDCERYVIKVKSESTTAWFEVRRHADAHLL